MYGILWSVSSKSLSAVKNKWEDILNTEMTIHTLDWPEFIPVSGNSGS